MFQSGSTQRRSGRQPHADCFEPAVHLHRQAEKQERSQATWSLCLWFVFLSLVLFYRPLNVGLNVGGRAAGDGGTQSDEQFFFNSSAKLLDGIGFPYVTNAANGGVGPGNQCLSLDTDGFASNTPCSPPLFTPEQTWIVG